jgi:hypothetical protein
MSGSMVLAIGLLVAAPAAWAALLRWARCPGWAVLGGVVAGLILGPTIFGRVLPNQYQDVFEGGAQQRLLLQALASPEMADRAEARAEAARQYRKAQWSHQRPLRLFVCIFVAALLAGSAVFGIPRVGGRQAMGALSMGAWSAALPGGLAFFFLRWAWDAAPHEAALAAAAVAIGPWALTAADRRAADDAEVGGARLVQTAGRVATLIALCLALGALWHVRQGQGLLWGASLVAIVLGWLIPAAARAPAAARELLSHLVVPAVAAAVAVKVDLLGDFAFWPILVILLLSGDARWLGAFAGATILGGRHGLRTLRLVLGSMAVGPTQLAVTAVAVHAWVLDARYVLALLLGAVLIETMAPARRGMARRLIKTEQEINQLED